VQSSLQRLAQDEVHVAEVYLRSLGAVEPDFDFGERPLSAALAPTAGARH